MYAPDLTPEQLAEQAGSAIGTAMVNAMANTTDQSQALCALLAALNEAFNPDDDPIVSAVAGGFAVAMVNVLERGFQAMRDEARSSTNKKGRPAGTGATLESTADTRNPTLKPEVDLASWSALGKQAKPPQGISPPLGCTMNARRLPPYARPIADARACGQVPRRLVGVHLAVTLAWNEHRTGAVPRVVMPNNPVSYDLRFVAGLDVLLPYTTADADRVQSAVDALIQAGAASVEVVNHDLRESGAPREAWLSVSEREELRHAD